MKAYFIAEGKTLSASSHGRANLIAKTFTSGQRLPDEYAADLEPADIKRLLGAGVIRTMEIPDPAPSEPKIIRVAPGHHLTHRQYGVEPIRAGEVVPDEILAEMGPGRVKQLIEAGTLTEHELEDGKGGAA